ncbi:MAG: metal-dependent transcriptional regulator [Eubacteriales bacterium]
MSENQIERRTRQNEEDYLKTILLLHKHKGNATPADMAQQLGMTASNVYSILANLERKCYITFEKGTRHKKPEISLTELGRELATPVLERHEVVQRWLMQLGVGEEDADEEACLLEHGLSDKTMGIIKRHVEMASGMFGSDIAYPEKMKMMMERLGERPCQGKTQSDKIFEEIDRHGGYENLVSANEFIRDMGGREKMRKTMELAKELGGYERIEGEMKLLKKHGNMDGLIKLRTRVRRIGGIEKAERVHRLVGKVGGERLLERAAEIVRQFDSFTETEKKTEILSKVAKLGGIREIERQMAIVERLGGRANAEHLGKIAQKLTEVFDPSEKL